MTEPLANLNSVLDGTSDRRRLLAIDARFYSRGHGIGRYARHLVDGLAEALNGSLVCLSPVAGGPAGRHRTLAFGLSHRLLWANLIVPILLRRIGAAIYHALDNLSLPIIAPRGETKFVLTVHDLIPLRMPQAVAVGHRFYFHLAIRRLLELADAIIAPSMATASEITSRFPAVKRKIRIVPLGVDTNLFRPVVGPRVRAFLHARYGISGDYILFVGTLQANKDVGRLLRAFSILAREHDGLFLVIAGRGREHARLLQEVRRLGLAGKVIFAGYVPDEDLPSLYATARAFVFPSVGEGFGLPPLEAMACGTPVIASNIPVCREVLGPAAVWVDPYRETDLADAISTVLRDTVLASALVQLGQERARAFPWERSIRGVLQVYRDIQGGPRTGDSRVSLDFHSVEPLGASQGRSRPGAAKRR